MGCLSSVTSMHLAASDASPSGSACEAMSICTMMCESTLSGIEHATCSGLSPASFGSSTSAPRFASSLRQPITSRRRTAAVSGGSPAASHVDADGASRDVPNDASKSIDGPKPRPLWPIADARFANGKLSPPCAMRESNELCAF